MHTIEPFVRQTYDLMQKSALVARSDPSFHDLSLLLADVPHPIYLDWCHLGEVGNQLIAQRMALDVINVSPAIKGLAQ
jgi:hypothetical protein